MIQLRLVQRIKPTEFAGLVYLEYLEYLCISNENWFRLWNSRPFKTFTCFRLKFFENEQMEIYIKFEKNTKCLPAMHDRSLGFGNMKIMHETITASAACRDIQIERMIRRTNVSRSNL